MRRLTFCMDPGVRAARTYILETMQGFSDRLDVGLDCYQVEAQGRIPIEAELCNVVATLPGRSDRRGDAVTRRDPGGAHSGHAPCGRG